MSDPLFAVDEKVILVSQNYPEQNGVYVVRDIGVSDTCEHHANRECWSYRLNTNSPDNNEQWCETQLRKIPPPDEQCNFDDVMTGLKRDDPVTLEEAKEFVEDGVES